MKTRSELKSESKELLKGHWGKAILLNIIPIAGSIISMSLKQSVQQTAMYLQEVPERTSEAPLLRLSERC